MLSNIKSTIKNSIIYGLGNLSSKLAGLVLLPLYTDKLSSSEYGVLGLLEVSSQALIGIFGLCLYQAFFRWYWQKEYIARQKSIFFTFTSVQFILAFLMVICLFPFLKYFSILLLEDPKYSWILFLMTISAGFDIINQAPNTLIRLKEKPILFTTANLIKLSVSLILTILFITYFKRKIDGIYYAQIIGQIIYLLVVSQFIFKNITVFFEWKILKEMFLFSFPLLISALSLIFLSLGDRFVLKIYGTLSDVGIYSLGFKMANTIQVFIVTSVNLAVSPIIYKMMDAPNNKRFYSKLMTYYAFGLMFFIIGMSVFGKEVIKVMAEKPEFWNAYKIIPIVSFSILFIALKDIAMTGLLIHKKSTTIAKIVIVISLFSIGCNFLFISLFKTMGGAIASLISQFTYFTIILIAAQKVYPIAYELKKLFLIFIVGAGLVSFAWFSNDLPLILRLTFKTLLILIFPIALYPFKFYETAEINALIGFWEKWKNPSKWKENTSNFKWNL
jgi:O-antigen/teichoic acid export membrane protein